MQLYMAHESILLGDSKKERIVVMWTSGQDTTSDSSTKKINKRTIGRLDHQSHTSRLDQHTSRLETLERNVRTINTALDNNNVGGHSVRNNDDTTRLDLLEGLLSQHITSQTRTLETKRVDHVTGGPISRRVMDHRNSGVAEADTDVPNEEEERTDVRSSELDAIMKDTANFDGPY